MRGARVSRLQRLRRASWSGGIRSFFEKGFGLKLLIYQEILTMGQGFRTGVFSMDWLDLLGKTRMSL